VGTSPDGKVYKVEPNGTGTVFFDPPDRYIWSLAVDRAGNVFAATGDKGVIYRITPDGRGAPFYETRATNVMSLAFDREGRLLAGTESPGRVFQIDAAGKPFVLLDSTYTEIRTLRVDPAGVIFAAAVRGGTTPGAPPARPVQEAPPAAAPVASVSTEITTITVVAEPAPQASAAPSAPPRQAGAAAGALYRIQPDGGWDLIWESREDTPYDVAFEPAGGVLLATGGEGKVFRLSGEPVQSTLVTRAAAQHVTALLPERSGQVLFTTSNPGRVLRLSTTRADRGSYTSDVRDALAVATWGAIKWQGATPTGARLEISTRSGNTRTPDDTWSDWSGGYSDATGSAITSPRARYLQWRALLTAGSGGAPVLTSVTAAYLPRNARPRVTAITIHPPGTIFQRPFPADPEIAGFEGDTPERRIQNVQAGAGGSGAALIGRRAYQKGLLTFVWRAEDENRDDITYDVEYRREGEMSWKPLRRGLSDAILVWDTTSVPNGRYTVRVTASDAPSNSPATALAGWMESTTFEIDNAPPSITIRNARRDGGRLTVTFDVRDEHSSVQKAEYSLGGDRWQVIYPRDGIADSRSEQFELVLQGDAAAQGVIIRATDALNNVASERGDAPASGGR